MATLDSLVRVIYPPQCLACRETVGTDGALCGPCWREATFLGGTRCDLCGVPLPGEADGGALLCDSCHTTPRPWTAGRAALAYDGTGRRLVMALKHGDRTDLPSAAAGWLARAAEGLAAPDMLVAPVPLHWMRLFRRAYNQSALLSQAFARKKGLDHCPDLLARTRATPSQEGRSHAERFTNLTDAIRVHPGRQARVKGRRILLIDDVLTSGATLAACSDACLEAGASEVRVLVLARVRKET